MALIVLGIEDDHALIAVIFAVQSEEGDLVCNDQTEQCVSRLFRRSQCRNLDRNGSASDHH